jgi:hypothetical protein
MQWSHGSGWRKRSGVPPSNGFDSRLQLVRVMLRRWASPLQSLAEALVGKILCQSDLRVTIYEL